MKRGQEESQREMREREREDKKKESKRRQKTKDEELEQCSNGGCNFAKIVVFQLEKITVLNLKFF